MRKIAGGLAALCLTAFVLGGCGDETKERADSLQDMEQPVDISRAEGNETEDRGTEDSRAEDRGTEDSGAEDRGTEDSRAEDSGTEDSGEKDGAGNDTGAGQTQEDREAALDKYISALEDIYFEQVFPDGKDYGYQPGENYDISSNSFAVYDIDFDGKEELIICYSTTYMGGMAEMIYGYDSASDSLQEEFLAFPSLTYYDNGMVEEQASHNHGMASDGGSDGNFWPYDLYRYDGEADRYVRIASVDAWSKAYMTEDYEGNPFPDEVDADGDGMVYYIRPEAEGEERTLMDGEAYDSWRSSLLKDAGELTIPYQKLTTDNIYSLTGEGRAQ